MKLYSYVVARDYGFAPNPFFGFCTLATCKADLRRHAQVGDWILGTGSKPNKLDGHAVYIMKVSEALTYDQYWQDPRFKHKRPNLRGSLKQAYGDNIYHRSLKSGKWIQENSHHSLPGGKPDLRNIDTDTKTDRMLVGTDFIYWGGSGPLIPKRFNICIGRGYKHRFPDTNVYAFISWIQSLGVNGYISQPRNFKD